MTKKTDAQHRFDWERRVLKARLGLRDTAVALALAAHWPNIHPGIEGLAEGIGASEKSVRRSLDSLEEQGFIRVKTSPNHRKGWATSWELVLPDHRTLSPLVDEGPPDSQSQPPDSVSQPPDSQSMTTGLRVRPTEKSTGKGTDNPTASTSEDDDGWGDPPAAPPATGFEMPSFDGDGEVESPASDDGWDDPWDDILDEVAERDRSTAKSEEYVPRYLRS